MPEAVEFLSAVDYSNSKTLRRESIVQNSIASAIEGYYGDYQRTQRTEGSRLWINPLMPIYWAFNLEEVAERNFYLNEIMETRTMAEITKEITEFRLRIETKDWEEMPV